MMSFLRKIWVVLFAFMIFGMLTWVPVDKYQKSYMNKLHQEKAKPQKRVDDAYKYVEKVEEGAIDTAPQKTVRVRPKKHIRQGRKPFFARDRKNPNILYPYKD